MGGRRSAARLPRRNTSRNTRRGDRWGSGRERPAADHFQPCEMFWFFKVAFRLTQLFGGMTWDAPCSFEL